MFANSGFPEEGVEGLVSSVVGDEALRGQSTFPVNRVSILLGHEETVRLDAVLQAIELPTGIAHLHTGLAHMDADTLALQERI